MERFIVEGGHRLEGTIRPGGNKNAALPMLAATSAHGRAGHAPQSPGHPRRREHAQAHRRARRVGRAGRAERRAHPREGSAATVPDAELSRQHSRFAPLRGTAARAVRLGLDHAARRRRDRAAAHRHAPHGAREPRSADRGLRVRVPHGGPASGRQADVPRRSIGDGDRERDHGGRPRRGRDDHLQRGGRAARPGSLSLPQRDGRADRGDRHQPLRIHGVDDLTGATSTSRATTSRSAPTSGWRRSRGEKSSSKTPSPSTCTRAELMFREARRHDRRWKGRTSASPTTRNCGCATRSAGRCRRSTTARGRSFRPTFSRSWSSWRRRPRGPR